MSRFDVAASQNARVRPVRVFHDKRISHVKIQVFEAVTVFVSIREMDLTKTDVVGNSEKGFQITQGITDFWYVSGELWVSCNQQTTIEAEAWPLPWILP